ncbi:MAG: hypothetical protein FJ288_06550 [Planctomycetes bacterium]|nr:hypothetical protein [Planctomycetota bacterium]
MKRRVLVLLSVAVFGALVAAALWVSAGEPARRSLGAGGPGKETWRSPQEVRFSPDGRFLAVCDGPAGTLTIIDAAAGQVAREVRLDGKPAGVAWSPDGKKVYVAEFGAGTVAEVDAAGAKVLRRMAVGPRPVGVALAPRRQLLIACGGVTNDVSVVDLASGKEKGRVRTPREPYFAAVVPDESLAVVGNLLPLGSAADPQTSACVSLIDLAAMKPVADIRLPGGSTAARGIAISPDGKWAYIVHTVGRTTLPTTQLERGWVNTNAFSIIDLGAKAVEATLLLDRLSEGAADPWGAVLSKDAGTLWVSLAGVHQVARVDLGGLHALLKGEAPPSAAGAPARYLPDTWAEIKKDPARKKFLVNDLAALYAAGLLARTPVDGKGPRGIDLAPDGSRLAVAMYFSGTVLLADPQTGKVTAKVRLGPDGEDNIARRGQRIFHDANYCFQHWLSCATCHPEDGRADGLNWDLLNDGLGNPKNARSLVWSHRTPPTMSHGVRATMEVAVVAGFRHIQFYEPEADELQAVQAYLRTLEPLPSPYLEAKGELSEAAKRGRKVFESPGTGCSTCHPAPLFTDLAIYNVGTRRPLDQGDEFDTPTLVELYRTGPYLHNGEAVTLEELFTKFNEKGAHGTTKDLSKQELADLVAYLLSL